MGRLETEVIKPEKCPECGSIFIDYQNGALRCLVKKCNYVFTKKEKIVNNKKIMEYN
jgi:ribosomal protein S27AE